MARANLKSKKSPEVGTKPACGLCGKTGKVYRTECCGNWICDDHDKYQLFSYARNSCARNHDRYTVCGMHFNEGHESADWKTCAQCREHYDKLEMFVWAATNEYNFTKLESPPEFEPTLCAKCKKRIHLGKEGYSIRGEEYFCTGCLEMPRFS
ncbi:MAG TPA: hypothetical protein VMK12_23950 [Anaeromyxobacteraceae bacterium]|nr:hypothetical protein [Anaeromyxobacteraceae bacterium]